MSNSANGDFLGIPNAQPAIRPLRERVGSIDDVSKLAPELNRAHLTVEPTSFASGNFSEVYGGTWSPPEHLEGVAVAIKVLRIPGQVMDPESVEVITKYGKHVGREVFVWQRVKHPRITPFVGYICEYRGIVPCIVTKRRLQGNLSVYLGKHPNADRLELLCQALEGLVYLHGFAGRSIIHLDIKPENILVTDEGSAELCDFGYAKVLGGEATGFTTGPHPGGTYPYCSPEVLDGAEWKELTPAADIFAIGSTILYILSGKQAWYYIQAKARLITAVSTATPPIRANYVMQGSDVALDALWDLLFKCWKLKPNERPSAQNVLDALRSIQLIGGIRPVPKAST